MRFRGRDALNEGVENLVANPVLSILAVTVAMVAFTTTLITTGISGNTVQRDYDNAVAAGAFAYLVSDRNANQLSVADCEGINAVDGVLASGAIMDSQEVTVNQGTTPLRLVRMTQGAVLGAWPNIDTSGGVISGSEAAERLGLTTGSKLEVDMGTGSSVLVISTVANNKSQIKGINDSLIIVAPPLGLTQECIVWADPGRNSSVSEAISGWFGASTLLSPYTPDVTTSERALTEASAFTHSFIWALAALTVVGLLLIVWLVRRQEVALYRILGASEKSILIGYCVDTVVLTLLPLQLSFLTALFIVPPTTSFVFTAVASDWIRLSCSLLLAPALAWLIYPRRSARDVMLGA